MVLIKSKFSVSTSDSEQCAEEVPNSSLLYYIYYYYKLTGPLPSALKKDFKNSVKKRALADPALTEYLCTVRGCGKSFLRQETSCFAPKRPSSVSHLYSDEPNKISHFVAWYELRLQKTRVLVLNCWKSEFFEILW